MAILQRQDGTVVTDLQAIQAALAPLGVRLNYWPTGGSARLQALLAQTALNEAEKEELLGHLDHCFQRLKDEQGYQSRDLIVLHEVLPGLGEILGKFDKCHTHADDEVRYIVDGEGIFGFVLPDRQQVELTVAAGDYINVPRDTEHWFRLTPMRRIKAVRYFSSTAGWVPEYTGTPVLF